MRAIPIQTRLAADPLPYFVWKVGFAAALTAGVLLLSPLAAISILVLFLCAGLLWRSGEPILAWCVAIQWVNISSGSLYWVVTGTFPGITNSAIPELAVWLSLAGLVAVSCGVRVAQGSSRRMFQVSGETDSSANQYSVQKICAVTSALFCIDWFMRVEPTTIAFNAAQIIQRLLELRTALLFLLLLTVLRQRRGYAYAAIALLVFWIPTLSSKMSSFSTMFILILLAIVSEWRPFSNVLSERRIARRRIKLLVGVAILLVAMGVAWTGAVKSVWRQRVLGGQEKGAVTEVALSFFDTFATQVSAMSWDAGAVSLVARYSSGVYYFGLVLERVPELLPHEHGALLWRALQHMLQPRILFPDKPIVESSSWLIRKYTGKSVAGSETDTSIGLTYMAELYIDFGLRGMFVALFLYGCVVGLFYRGLRAVAPSYDIFRAVSVIMLAFSFTSYEGEIIKDMGGLLQAFLIFSAALWLCGPFIHSALLRKVPRGGRRLSPRVTIA